MPPAIATTPMTPAPTAIPFTGQDVNLLVASRGEVTMQRWTWMRSQPAYFGAVLHRGDTLALGPEATALVLCDDLRVWQVPAGSLQGVANGCPPGELPDLRRTDGNLGPTRSVPEDIPYILAPRATAILTDTPLLRWHPVPGVVTYTVAVRGSGLAWTEEVTGTEVVYAGVPSLEPGDTYKLIVTADTGISSEKEDAPGLGFRLLTEAEAAEVAAERTRIERLNLPEPGTALALAHYYAAWTGEGSSFHLLADAISQLETLAVIDDATPGIYLTLGDLYRQARLLNEADAAYKQAMEAADAASDLETAALARLALAEIYQPKRDLETEANVRTWLDEAAAIFTKLGDTQQADSIEETSEP